LTRIKSKFALQKIGKTATRFFSMRFLGIFPSLCSPEMPKNRPVFQVAGSNSFKKRPTVMSYEKSRVAAKKWERGPPGEGLPFFRLTGPALFGVCLMGGAD
jgi:hypothetical protein